MLEQKIEELTVAVNALAAAIAVAGSGAAAAPAKAKPAKEKVEPAKAANPQHSKAEVQAAINEVKENFDTATAKALIKSMGFDKLADITEDKYDELYNAAKAKMAEMAEMAEKDSGDGL